MVEKRTRKSTWLDNRTWSILLFLLIWMMSVYRLPSAPPIWFDEGWSLSLARNWAQMNHYGHLLLGYPIPSTILNTGFPAVGPLALSFKLFGVGSWQGRLPGCFFVFGSCLLLYCVADQLYGTAVAKATLLVALFLPVYADLHPVIIGRQAIGEMPAVFFLLLGYVCLLWAWRKSTSLVVLPALSWALSLRTKPQVLPFLAVSLGLTMVISFVLHHRKTALRLLLIIACTLAMDRILAALWSSYVSNHSLSEISSTDPYVVLRDIKNLLLYVVVLDPKVRLNALRAMFLLAGTPALVGLSWIGVRLSQRPCKMNLESGAHVVQLLLWSFVSSWFAWYLALSISWPRYLFPAAFLGSVFFAALLFDITNGFKLKETVLKGASILRWRDRSRDSLAVSLLLVLVIVALSMTMKTIYRVYSMDHTSSLLQTSEFLNTQMRSGKLVETYESELFFLLDGAYHYPPDDVQHQLNRRTFLGENVSVDYTPIAQNPDYIVSGPSDHLWRLYDDVLARDDFALVFETDRYQVYQHVRR